MLESEINALSKVCNEKYMKIKKNSVMAKTTTKGRKNKCPMSARGKLRKHHSRIPRYAGL